MIRFITPDRKHSVFINPEHVVMVRHYASNETETEIVTLNGTQVVYGYIDQIVEQIEGGLKK